MYGFMEKPLSHDAAVEILFYPDEAKMLKAPPWQPRHGEAFLFSSDGDESKVFFPLCLDKLIFKSDTQPQPHPHPYSQTMHIK